VDIDDSFYKAIKEVLYQNSGIYLNENKKDISKIKIRKFFEQYHLQEDAILRIETNTSLAQKLINFFTVSETYFFREKHQMEILVNLFDENKKTRILSAPCASGEEVYTFLISLKEHRKKISNLTVVGADINSEKIDLAIKGAYTKEKLKDVPQKIIDKYFIKKDDLFFVDKTLKTNISFKNLNVLDPRINNLGKFDVIFSRNMFIYFDDNAKEKAIKIFYHILKDDGYLFLGHADSAKNIHKFFKSVKVDNSIIYQKIKGAI